ncbi:Mucin-associated surface protein (MASP) [Trypanosoma cruzi]|uniref:Mucin-associated surface protein (MASP), putative n=2 Tax=Trypanosoma cruzi TaxID=5693 RepID=Q4D7D5_TRYCC|nr:mucin-associated surface protein (MASP), putative [Trypanosoma cruzi]EAN88436.1 mucin-associated surface protein (MASP), putative [Trypanosoma cruzi]PWV03455.1 Mucin-associated surface protein (MASP) [Trypanosoma cruzi]|eukprot:XP_810287.1 mucin-associated surface protein (MASP) [Trypanosoma cruzi strain CL Brener]
MAMMMTGRVLLVCVLCVLWCGAGGSCDVEVPPAVEPLVHPASGSGVNGNASGHTVTGEAEVVSLQQSRLDNVGNSAAGYPQLQAALEPESPTEQPQSDPEHMVPSTHSQSSGEGRQDGTPDGQPGKPGISPSQEDNKDVSIENQQSNDPPSHSGNDDVVSRNSGERTEDDSRRAETLVVAPSEEGQEPENVTPSLEQPLETSTAAPAVTTQTTSITLPEENESNTVKMNDAAPHSTVTANTNHTVTPAENDSSTAVSHATSPLLLLVVVVACAAAVVVA